MSDLLRQQITFAQDLNKLLDFTESLNIDYTLGECERTAYQQAEYIRTGKSSTMNSMHLQQCAADIYFYRENRLLETEEIRPMGEYWEELSEFNYWGGRWQNPHDPNHFERVDNV